MIDAQYKLGEIYEQGLCYECIDADKAAHWYNQAARKKSEKAVQGLFRLAKKGNANALKALINMGEKGFKEVQYCLGELYREGTGVPKDYSQASEWYKRASNKLEKAIDALARLALEGNVNALQSLTELGNKNNVKAQQWLAEIN